MWERTLSRKIVDKLCEQDVIAVSYTHLEGGQQSGQQCAQKRCNSGRKARKAHQFQSERVRYRTDKAVSYTHLDVYKRQQAM